MESVSKDIIVGQKIMEKSGLEKKIQIPPCGKITEFVILDTYMK